MIIFYHDKEKIFPAILVVKVLQIKTRPVCCCTVNDNDRTLQNIRHKIKMDFVDMKERERD